MSKKLYCSFCSKSNNEVLQMVVSDHGGVICNECIQVCTRVILEANNSAPATANFPTGPDGEYL